MITDKVKAAAIARLRLGDTVEIVSSSLDIPTMLVKEWFEGLDLNDTVRLEANVNALVRIKPTESNVELLKTNIEQTAIEIVEAVRDNLPMPDIVQAKSLNLLANTCAVLYASIVGKAGSSSTPMEAYTKSRSLFEQLTKD